VIFAGMNDKRRLLIIIASVSFGTVLAAGLFMLRGGGSIRTQDYGTLFTNFVFALAIVVLIGLVLKGRKKK